MSLDQAGYDNLTRERDLARIRLTTIEREQTSLAAERDGLLARVAVIEHALDEHDGGEVAERDAGLRFVANAREQLPEGGGRRR